MAKRIGFSDLFNGQFWQESNERKMNFTNIVEIVNEHFPMTVRFGGFDKNDRTFLSRGETPYKRSFQVQWDTSEFTLIGWPCRNEEFTEELSKLRSEIEKRCNIRHRYGTTKSRCGTSDNDFHMVLGEIRRLHLLTDSESKQMKTIETALVEESIREHLRKHRIDIEIKGEQLFLAQYVKETLPLDSTNVYCIQDRVINNSFIQNLYSERFQHSANI